MENMENCQEDRVELVRQPPDIGGARLAPYKGRFSFVNKNAANIKLRDHTETVYRHVSYQYERWKRNQRHDQLLTAVQRFRTPFVTPTLLEDRSLKDQTTYQADSVQDHCLIFNTFDTLRLSDIEVGSSANSSDSNCNSRQEIPLSDHTWYTQTLLHSLCDQYVEVVIRNSLQPEGDSMFASPEQMSLIIGCALESAYLLITPSLWPQEDYKMRHQRGLSLMREEMMTAFHDECYAHSWLCFHVTLMSQTDGGPDLPPWTSFLRLQTIRMLRQRITDATMAYSLTTLRAVLGLFCTETALDNTADARVHMKWIHGAVKAGDGLNLLDPWFHLNLMSADSYFALKYDTRPLFAETDCQLGFLTQGRATRLSQDNVSDEHARQVDSTVTEPILRNIILELRSLFATERSMSIVGTERGSQMLNSRQLRRINVINRLANHGLNLRLYPYLYRRPELQLATCHAVTLMTAMVLGSPEPVRFGLKLISDLRSQIGKARRESKRIEHVAASQEIGEEPLFFWLAYVGTLGEQTHPVQKEALWFENELTIAAHDHSMSMTEARRTIPPRFLYSTKLEEEVNGRRAFRTSDTITGVYLASGTSWRNPLTCDPAC